MEFDYIEPNCKVSRWKTIFGKDMGPDVEPEWFCENIETGEQDWIYEFEMENIPKSS